jgi:hypothetical protein
VVLGGTLGPRIQIDLRERIDLYSGLRSTRLYHAADTPLKDRAAGEIDLLIGFSAC